MNIKQIEQICNPISNRITPSDLVQEKLEPTLLSKEKLEDSDDISSGFSDIFKNIISDSTKVESTENPIEEMKKLSDTLEQLQLLKPLIELLKGGFDNGTKNFKSK